MNASCPVVYEGKSYPQFHGTKCVLLAPHPFLKHWGEAPAKSGRSLRWLTEEEKKTWPPKDES